MTGVGCAALVLSLGLWMSGRSDQVALAKFGIPTPPLVSRVFSIEREEARRPIGAPRNAEMPALLRPAVGGFQTGNDTVPAPASSGSRVPHERLDRSLDYLEIPRIDLSVPVRLLAPNTVPEQPVAGWMFGSGLPGLPGNLVILGHVDGDSAIFGRLSELAPGDEIRIHAGTRLYIYVVNGEDIVHRSAVDVLDPSATPTMTLLTCSGTWDESAGTYDDRLVVRAEYIATGSIPS